MSALEDAERTPCAYVIMFHKKLVTVMTDES